MPRPSSLEDERLYNIIKRGCDSHNLFNDEQRFTNVDLHLGYDLPSDTHVWADMLYSKQKKGFIVPNRMSQKYGDTGYNTPINPDFPASDGEYMYGGMGAYPEVGSWWEKERCCSMWEPSRISSATVNWSCAIGRTTA